MALFRLPPTNFRRQPLREAADAFTRALSVWEGSPLAGLNSQLIRPAAVRLVERRLAVVEERIDVRLALGDHHELIDELMVLTAEHPVREKLRAQLMTALYRDGRKAEALDVYRQTRRALVARQAVRSLPFFW